MLTMEETDSSLVVRYRCLVPPLLLLVLPPALLYEQSGRLLDGSLTRGELIGLVLGIVLPLVIVARFVEFARFEFSKSDDVFRWCWRNLFRQRSGEAWLGHVVRVNRDALDATDLVGMQTSYRLLVTLEDGSHIALTRSYSGFHDRQLKKTVDQIRDYLGHFTPMD